MFRILKFTSHTHPRLKNKTFELSDENEISSKNYYSIIIGPNGTGKSYLLGELIEAFNELVIFQNNPNYRIRKKFTIVYNLDGQKYSVIAPDRGIIILKGSMPIDIDSLSLPNAWLASSVTLGDRYPLLNYIRELQIPQYKYLGVRSASNNAFISRIKINTVLYLIKALQRNKAKNLMKLYTSLSLNPTLQIELTGGSMLKLRKEGKIYHLYPEKDARKILDPHLNFIDRNREKKNYRTDNYLKYLDDEKSLDIMYKLIYDDKERFEKTIKGSIKFTYTVNLESEEGVNKLLNDWPALTIMLDLELIKFSKFLITKKTSFKFEEASSGESHLLTSLHGIIAYLEDNSLLVVDEPEISLHPNWQLDYFDILRAALKEYTGVNVVISSHSHLLMSSLLNEESRISSIKPENGTEELIVEELDFSTYGWDPESVLYNVFEVATLRNKYFEMDLKKLISLITLKSDDRKSIKELRDKVAKYITEDNDDPLQLLINEVDSYLKS